MDKKLAFALGVTTILSNVQSAYALEHRDTTEELRKAQIKPSRTIKVPRRDPLKLSVRFNDEKAKGVGAITEPSVPQNSLTNKKLSRREVRASRRNLALALKASKKSALSALITSKMQTRVQSQRHKRVALQIGKIDAQQTRLQQKKNLLITKLPATLASQKIPLTLASQKIPVTLASQKIPVTLEDKKIPAILVDQQLPQEVLLTPLVTPVAENKNSEPMGIIASPVISLPLEVSTQEVDLSSKPALEELQSVKVNPLVSENILSSEDLSSKPSVLKSEGLDELSAENLTPYFKGVRTKVLNLLERLGGEDLTGVINEIKSGADNLTAMARIFDASSKGEYDSNLEGGYNWDNFHDEGVNPSQQQPHQEQPSSQEDKDLKKTPLPVVEENDDLKKGQTINPSPNSVLNPLVTEDSALDMELHKTKIESLEKTIVQFQYASFQLRENAERGDPEEKKRKLREQLTEAHTIEKSISSLKLHDSDSNFESVNTTLKSHEDEIGKEKVRLSAALETLLNREVKNDQLPVPAPSLDSITQNESQDEKMGSLNTQSIETGVGRTGVATPVELDSDGLSRVSVTFPNALGSLKDQLNSLLKRVDLDSKDLPWQHKTIKLYSAWLKDSLVEIEKKENNIDSPHISLVDTIDENYSFASDMKNLSQRISDFLTLPVDFSKKEWEWNTSLSSGNRYVEKLSKDLSELTRELEEATLNEKDLGTVATSQPIENLKNEDPLLKANTPLLSPHQQSPQTVVEANQPKGYLQTLLSYIPSYSKTVVPSITPGNDNTNGNNNNNVKDEK